jgi:O-antigen ligase
MSTLRGANPLGAYLILPLSAVTAAFIRQKRQRWNIGILGAGLWLALIFSFSRSAWIGALLAAAVVVWLGLRSNRAQKIIAWCLGGLLLIAVLLGIALRNNLSFENFIFHTDKVSKISVSSNQGHSAAFKAAARDIVHHPLGSGVGTAGPQSVYNHKPARIAENYFLQIGQEAGLAGLLLFVAIVIMLGKTLFERKLEPLALILFASLIGLSFVNLLSHAWADDTLAYLWWGLAGIALSPVIITNRHNQKNAEKIKTA